MNDFENNNFKQKSDIQRMLSLLKEYKIELLRMRNEYISICNNLCFEDKSSIFIKQYKNEKLEKIDYNLLKKQKKYFHNEFHNFENSIQKLIRSASQYIDHGNVSFMNEIELQLRLADIEKELHHINILIENNY
ncbi:hypothetical protein [uncultured Desulfobulbus sp.]|uniref:hypothetical protein n=1 Tax=uncultured Desulfobulbus sp. TaxID=239745 RepID=UPI0029C7FC22|nr:hypothetical protein [uncultured Desulfobulbus sp.]